MNSTVMLLIDLAESLVNGVVLGDLPLSEAIDAAAREMQDAVACDPVAAATALGVLHALAHSAENEIDADAFDLAADVIRRAKSLNEEPTFQGQHQ